MQFILVEKIDEVLENALEAPILSANGEQAEPAEQAAPEDLADNPTIETGSDPGSITGGENGDRQ
jgi:hypothetical protein